MEDPKLGAFLDHTTRYPVADRWYLGEDIGTLRDTLLRALLRFGIPKVAYTDRGAVYRAEQLAYSLAALGSQVVELPDGRITGHTFHYSKSETPLEPLARAKSLTGRDGEAVYRLGTLTASYVHFYFPSNPAAVATLFGA